MSCQFSLRQCGVKTDHVWSGQDTVRSCQSRTRLARRSHDSVRVDHVMSGQMRSDEVRLCQSKSRSPSVLDTSGHVRSGHVTPRMGMVGSGKMSSGQVR